MTERRPKPDGTDARRRLIEAAAEHFARQGFEAASQRAIQREAGVNPAAAHYYFGSKEAMYRAVVDTFIHDIQKERILRHASLGSDMSPKMRLRQLLYDYFEPSLAVADTRLGYNYVVILARLSTEPTQVTRGIFDEIVFPVRNVFIQSLMELFPAVSKDDIDEVLAMGVTLMATLLTRRTPDEHIVPAVRAKEDAGRLADFVGAGFEALFGPAATPGTR